MKFTMQPTAPSGVILPDSRFEAPELWTPGRKPVGNVKINVDHKAAQGLLFVCLPRGTDTRDYVTGESPTVTVPDEITFNPTSINFDPSEQGYGTPRPSLRFNTTTSGDVAVLFKYRLNPSVGGGFGRIIDTKELWGGDDGFYIGARGSGNFEIRGGGTDYRNGTFTQGTDWHVGELIYVGAQVWLYVDGATIINGLSIGAITSVERAVTVGHDTGDGDYSFDGDIEYVYVYDSSRYSRSYGIPQDPYQFLVNV